MKSRLSKRSRPSRRRNRPHVRRSPHLRGNIETLEPRCLLASVTGMPEAEGEFVNGVDLERIEGVSYTAFLPTGTTRTDFVDHFRAIAGGTSQSVAEGIDGFANFILTSEVEPNDSINTANRLPLGIGPGLDSEIDVQGNLQLGDTDFFVFDLKAGDILGANVDTALDLSLQRVDGMELIGSQQEILSFALPSVSPLPRGGTVALADVITQDGTYAIQVGSGVSPYRLNLRVFRPVLESEPVGTKQILFLDFDGAVVDTSIFGAAGFAGLSPLSSFLANWGLGPADEDRVIDAIVATVEENFQDIRDRGTNGDFRTTGNPGDFDIEILNSRDHADPFGLPNVSRVIVGGTILEFGIPTVGIAQSVDVGNFATEETAVVLLDELSDPNPGNPISLNQYPIAGTATKFDLIGEGVGGITAHEAGHFFAAWHQDNTNAVLSLMDTGGNLDIIVGVGPDGIFGTTDDVDVDFEMDIYDPNEGYRGTEDPLNTIGHGLSTGTDGATIRGVKWHDFNGNGLRDLGEPGLEGWTIFVDANGNLRADTGEFQTVTELDGSYELLVPSGVHRIAEEQQDGWTQTFPFGNAGTHLVTVNTGDILEGINFGNKSIAAGISGHKFLDLDGDGVQDADEPGLAGVRIFIDENGDLLPGLGEPSDVTDDDGNYFITVPLAGTYTVREVVPPGFTQTFPAGDGSHTVDVQSNTVTGDINFGNSGPLLDFGDAPDPYPVRLEDNGARHGLIGGFQLGGLMDGEVDGQPAGDARGDDLAGDADEDGIQFTTNLFAGGQATLEATVSLGGQSRGYLQGWVDFDRNGNWESDEQIILNARLGEGTHPFNFNVPAGALTGATHARFRYGWERNIGPTGPALGGEVEDYQVTIFGDQPVANDDVFDGDDAVDQDSSDNFLDVLANDFPSSSPPLLVLSTDPVSIQGGLVSPTLDGSGVLYTPPIGFFGTDGFQYTLIDGAGKTDSASVSVSVRPAFDGPVAVDDTFEVAANSSNNFLLVLSNDLDGPFPPKRLGLIVSGPSNGSANIFTQGTPDPADDVIRYTPNPNFNGVDFITYRIFDSLNNSSDATATITVGDQASRADVEYSVRFADGVGNPLSTVVVGTTFFAEVQVRDTRPNPVPPPPADDRRGVFAAYLDVLYPTGQITVAGPLIFDGAYQSVPVGNTFVPGIVDEAGAFRGDPNLPPPGTTPQLVFRIPVTAVSVGDGVAEFRTNPADLVRTDSVSGLHDTLVYEPETDIPPSDILYSAGSIAIVSAGSGEGEDGFHNWVLPADVNNDGVVTPGDVLPLVNKIQRDGIHTLEGGGEGEQRGRQYYFDVVPDGVLDLKDLLSVVRSLRQSLAEGEAPLAIGNVEAAEGELDSQLLTTLSADSSLVTTALVSPSSNISPADLAPLDARSIRHSERIQPRPASSAGEGEQSATIDLVFSQRSSDTWLNRIVRETRQRLARQSELDSRFYEDILEGWLRSDDQS